MEFPLTFARFFCRHLPPRLAASIYYRFLDGRSCDFIDYEDAPLRVAAPFHMKLMPGDSAHGCIAWCGFYEPQLTRHLRRVAKSEGGMLVDAGANYGYFSLLWTAARDENRVVAYEASGRNLPHLMENIRINHLQGRISAIHKALGASPGTATVRVTDAGQSGWDRVSCDPGSTGEPVQLTTLDAEYPAETFTALKIDCEGFELDILRGAENLLREHRVRHVFFESNPTRLTAMKATEDDACRLLLSHGYQISHITPHELHAFVHPRATQR